MSRLLILDLIECKASWEGSGRFRLFTFNDKSREILDNVGVSMYGREYASLVIENLRYNMHLSYLSDISLDELVQIRLPFDHSEIILVNEKNGFQQDMLFSTFAVNSINISEWVEE